MAWIEGEKVGGYVLGKQLGQGGMATVYLGHHPELDRKVAIKVMHQNFLEDEGFVARFKREAQIVAKLTHPHIVPVYDFNEHDGQPYLVMKYIQGWTLKKQLIKDPLDLDGILRVMAAIGDALNFAHEHDILHRDIKPSNIVIDFDSTPYLADFGLARLASSGESTMSADMLLGTPHYISPEQARGAKTLDGRTDIYSLGVVLYELLVGKVPFTGDSAFSIIHDHIYTPLPPPTKVNPELPATVEKVLYKALEKKPSDRYETANELIEELSKAIKNSDLTKLDPNRASVAAVSLAKIREEYDEQLTVTPPRIGIGSAMPSGSSNLRQATMYPKKKPFYDQDRFWFIGGCASLLVIVFVSFGVLLGMAGNLQELAALSIEAEEFSDIRADIFAETVEIVTTYNEFGVRLNPTTRVPTLIIPYREFSTLPEADGDSVLALVRARSLYEEDRQDDARQEVITGTPDTVETTVLYYVSAARIALDADDTGAAIVFSIVASESAIENEELFNLVRPMALEFIYENVTGLRGGSIAETMRSILGDGILSEEVVTTIEDSLITNFATTRILVLNGNDALARAALARVSEPNVISAEMNLLRAELQISLGNADNAQDLLEGILGGDDAPDWVQNRVEDLQTELE